MYRPTLRILGLSYWENLLQRHQHYSGSKQATAASAPLKLATKAAVPLQGGLRASPFATTTLWARLYQSIVWALILRLLSVFLRVAES